VLREPGDCPQWPEPDSLRRAPEPDSGPGRWRFSLAGVALKFSLLRQDDRLTLPSTGSGGDRIVKLPDARHPAVPRNEYVTMLVPGLRPRRDHCLCPGR